MDLINITLEELHSLKNEKEAQLIEIRNEYNKLGEMIEEKIKLDKLKSQLEGVSQDTINTLIKSMTLSPGSIDSTESTVQS